MYVGFVIIGMKNDFILAFKTKINNNFLKMKKKPN